MSKPKDEIIKELFEEYSCRFPVNLTDDIVVDLKLNGGDITDILHQLQLKYGMPKKYDWTGVATVADVIKGVNSFQRE